MIPIKLKMRNFMCYRDDIPPLDFTGIHTACISGDNGNGKSALIDAMTWALWGKARSNSADDLIYQGQNEMEVEFDFAVGSQPYRIIRKRSRPKKAGQAGQSILEFQIAQGEGFRSITGNPNDETQLKIISVLHMDYETFVNSALLLQGHADAFTKKRPAERAQVLSDILGFSYYDALAQDANNMAKAAESEKSQLETDINDILTELAGREQVEADFERIQQELAAIAVTIEAQGKKLEELKRQKEVLESKKRELDTIDEHLAAGRKDLARWETQKAQHELRLKEYEALISRRIEIEKSYSEFIEMRRQDADMNQCFKKAANLNDSRSRLLLSINKLQQGLNQEQALTARKISELEASLGKLPELKKEQQKSQEALAELSRREIRVLEKRKLADETRATVHELKLAANQLEQKSMEIDEKIKLLQSDGDHCPLCNSEIGDAGLKSIENNYALEKEKTLQELKTKRNDLSKQQKTLESLDKEVALLEISLNKERPGIQGRASVIEKELKETEEAREKLAESKETLDEIESHITSRDFAAGEEKALSDIENEIKGLDYDPTRHQEVQKRVAALELYAELKRKLDEADRLIGVDKEAAERAANTMRKINSSLETDNKRKETLSREIVQLPVLRNDTLRAEKEQNTLIEAQKKIEAALYITKAKIENFNELEKKRAEKKVLLAKAIEDQNIYKELAQAFGKKGIQTMFIEMVLPEIEVEADKLLGRMTDNRMHLKIETQRQKKSGDVMETLDINISDELGTRDYEMYSGGEAFRINFAIRIALSRLLARRAGAPLPTLVIDEGFGTQDSTGIEKVKEAINAIEYDFDKILVITHIDELRDAFPNRINVVKGANGSTIEVS